MLNSRRNSALFKAYFSHVYIEKKAMNHSNSKKILEHFRQAEIVEINHYKDVFSRAKQDYCMQKHSPKLILAVKDDDFVYRGAPLCEDFGNANFYYASTVMNCIYDCEYCYLQGMYATANIVVFVNIEDFFGEVESLLKKRPVYLCISYDSDLLALEKILGHCE
ncbi:MAG: radical SAM protein, partial [Clostridiaceae bacterium]|nr:radical SAM protein [Clostridiaceae bacterium]